MSTFHLDQEGKLSLLIIFRDGVSFQLDGELYKGYTNRSETYNNFKLNQGNSNQFKCLEMEVYALM